ncbi:MAG: tetratricopeptide repeat protein, partial [Nannocystaceae bacterium]
MSLVVFRVSGGLEGQDAAEAAAEEDALASAEVTDDGEGAAAKNRTVEGPDPAEVLEALPEVAPESERRCLMVAPAALSDDFKEDERWISFALEVGVTRVLTMRPGIRLRSVTTELKDELKVRSIRPGDVIPVSLLLDKATKQACDNVITMDARRVPGEGDLMQVEVSLYLKGQRHAPLKIRTDPLTLMPLAEFIAGWTLPGLGLPETPALPSLADTMSANPRVLELNVRATEKILDEDFDTAGSLLDEALALDPECVDTLRSRAAMYAFEQGPEKKAQQQKLLAKVLKQLHRLPPASRWQVQTGVLLAQNKRKVAERIVDRQLEIDPDDVDAKLLKTTLLMIVHDAAKEALPYLRDIVARDPKNREALSQLVLVLNDLEQLEEAEIIARQWVA